MVNPESALTPGDSADRAAPSRTVEWSVAAADVPYPQAIETMERRVKAIREAAAPEWIWLLEHPPLYTAGTSADPRELLEPGRLPVFQTGRGGRHTYHGPGQRIAYVMLDLAGRGRDLRRYVFDLEQWIINTLAAFDIIGERRQGRIGIWVDQGDGAEAKIAALGVRVRHWVSFHGIAINVDPDLGQYQGIVPCGIADHGVTSMAALGVSPGMAAVDEALRSTFSGVFGGGHGLR